MFAFMLVYNSIKGNYTDIEDNFYEVEFPYIYVSSPAEYRLFEKYFVDKSAYTDDELREIANLSIEDLKAKALTISIEDAIARSEGK